MAEEFCHYPGFTAYVGKFCPFLLRVFRHLLLTWFPHHFFPYHLIKEGDLVRVVTKDVLDSVYFSLFNAGAEVVCVDSVDKISNGGHLVFIWVTRVSWDNGIRS